MSYEGNQWKRPVKRTKPNEEKVSEDDYIDFMKTTDAIFEVLHYETSQLAAYLKDLRESEVITKETTTILKKLMEDIKYGILTPDELAYGEPPELPPDEDDIDEDDIDDSEKMTVDQKIEMSLKYMLYYGRSQSSFWKSFKDQWDEKHKLSDKQLDYLCKSVANHVVQREKLAKLPDTPFNKSLKEQFKRKGKLSEKQWARLRF